MSEKRLILGGVFATHTEMDEKGNVTQRDEFHTRLYWNLWHSGAMMKLKGARLHVLLTIAQHADKNGEGFPGVRRLSQLLPYNKDAINKAIKELIKLGFLSRTQKRRQEGKFGNNHYTIQYTAETNEKPCTENTDADKNPENKDFSPCTENTDAVKTGNGKPVHKEDIYFKEEQQQEKKKKDVVVVSSEPEKQKTKELKAKELKAKELKAKELKAKELKAKELKEKFDRVFKKLEVTLPLTTSLKFIDLGEKHGRDVINDSLKNTVFALKHKMNKTGEKPQNPAGALRNCIIEGWKVDAPKLKPKEENSRVPSVEETKKLLALYGGEGV